MPKSMRANYIAARLLNGRPDGESYETFAIKHKLPLNMSIKRLCNRRDVPCGLLYRICRALGYQVIVYNPNPPEGMDKMYVLGEAKRPIAPREYKGVHSLRKDSYTNTIYRVPRKYKKKARKIA